MSWDSYAQSAEKGPVRFLLKVGFSIMVVAMLLGGVSFMVKVVFAPMKSAGDIIQKTVDADNVIHNYEYFKQQFRAVEAIDNKIVMSQANVDSFKADAGPRSDWTFEDKTESSRLGAIATGLMHQRQDMVSDYNAKANMMNRQMFMGKDCPQYIEP